MSFEKLSERTIFRDQFIGLREDILRTPSGQLVPRKVVEYRKAVAVVPVMADGRILVVRQYRHPIGRAIWDLPGGMIEPGEAPADTGARELYEETGYLAASYDQLLRFRPEPAFSNHEIYVLRANEARPCAEPAEEEILGQRLISRQDLPAFITREDVVSSWTVIGLLLIMSTL